MTLTLGIAPLASGAPTTANYVLDGPERKLLFSPFPRRIRAELNGVTVLDSDNAMLLHESDVFPVVYVPVADVAMDRFTRTDRSTHCPYKGDASYWTITAGGKTVDNAAWAYESPIEPAAWLEGYLAVEWGRMDHWFDEDDEIFGHIRDPFHRVDARPTSRRVQVRIDGNLVADSTSAFVVSETGFENVYYLPPADIETERFEGSDTTSHCPHKGDSVYWNLASSDTVEGRADIAWSYPKPLEEATRVAGHWAFMGTGVEVTVSR